MKAKQWYAIAMVIPVLILVASCDQQITVHAHVNVTDLQFDDKYVGTLPAGSETKVWVTTLGVTLVNWKCDGQAASDYIDGTELPLDAVLHLHCTHADIEEK